MIFIYWLVLLDSVVGSYLFGICFDVFVDGMIYVGLVLFCMSSIKFGIVLLILYVGIFLEINVWLYFIDNVGWYGVFFWLLEIV